jgi:DNA polymerase-3 subunit chi
VTRVDFYVLEAGGDARARFACRLTEKVYRLGHRVVVHTDGEAAARRLDELLWTWRDGSFVPHRVWDAGVSEDDAAATPVFVAAGEDCGLEADVLINLGASVPGFFSRFERVVEIVDGDAESRNLSRQRFAFYRDRGYPMDTHRI